jgi:hypothetical protein
MISCPRWRSGRRREAEKSSGYAPANLLKFDIYGYLNRVRSSRSAARHGRLPELLALS